MPIELSSNTLYIHFAIQPGTITEPDLSRFSFDAYVQGRQGPGMSIEVEKVEEVMSTKQAFHGSEGILCYVPELEAYRVIFMDFEDLDDSEKNTHADMVREAFEGRVHELLALKDQATA